MSRNEVINIFKKELKKTDSNSKIAQAMELAIELLRNDKVRLASQENALEQWKEKLKNSQ